MKQWYKTMGVAGMACILAISCVGCSFFESGTKKMTVEQEQKVESTSQEETESQEEPTAQSLLEEMGKGWNLGNALDAYDLEGRKEDTETLFGNPKVTEELIQEICQEGFQTIRVPVTYVNHIDEEGNIDVAWLDRVEEVVQAVLEQGVYCVIDVHHDTGAHGWLQAESLKLAQEQKIFAAMWEQIAARFESYDTHLMFEGYNEILNEENQWSYAGEEAYVAANALNQTFVDTVRESGGNNAKRYLIVNTYAASAEEEVLSQFVLPEDTIENHLFVGVHSYVGSNELSGLFQRLSKYFTTKEIPVIIGEFGMDRTNEESARVAYASYYQEHALENGIGYFWWDDGNYSDTSSSAQDVCNYALYNRVRMEWAYQEIADALLGK